MPHRIDAHDRHRRRTDAPATRPGPTASAAAPSSWCRRPSASTTTSRTSPAGAAAAGYHAVAPDFFHRSGAAAPSPTTATSGQGDRATSGPSSDDAAILDDVDAALDHLRAPASPTTRSGSSGSASAAASPSSSRCAARLGAAVGFYGGGIVTGRFPQFPPLIDEVGVAADAVARALRRPGRFDPRRRRRDAAHRVARRAGRHRDRALRRRRARLPLRHARRLPRRRRRRRLERARSTGSPSTSSGVYAISAILSALPRLSVVAVIVPVFLGGTSAASPWSWRSSWSSSKSWSSSRGRPSARPAARRPCGGRRCHACRRGHPAGQVARCAGRCGRAARVRAYCALATAVRASPTCACNAVAAAVVIDGSSLPHAESGSADVPSR